MTVSKRDWLILLCAALTVAAAVYLRPLKQASDQSVRLEESIPRHFADWDVDPSVIPIKPTPDVQQKLDQTYSEVLSRTYVNKHGLRVMLTIAYGGDQSDALKAHRQEYCYAAQGFNVSQLRDVYLKIGISNIPAVRLVAQTISRVEPVTYWFTMGGIPVRGRVERLFTQISAGLHGQIPDGMLVRISSLTNEAATFESHVEFASQLSASITSPVVKRLAGF